MSKKLSLSEMEIINDIEKELLYSNKEKDGNDFIEDSDTCSAFELDKSFHQKYKIKDESSPYLTKEFILKLCADSSYTRVAAGYSNSAVHIIDVNGQRGLSSLANFEPLIGSGNTPENICGIRFLDDSSNSLLIGTTNGIVRLFDLRTNKEEARFGKTSENSTKMESLCKKCQSGAKDTFTSFDRNANSRILCVGTQKNGDDVFLIFFDVRQLQEAGRYCDSHNDDVTAVRFHDVNPDMLCTGSTDGLINIFNIAEESEDDALMTTINTESSVQKLNWHKDTNDQDVISCITHTNDFKLYESEEGVLMAEFERERITEQMKRKAPANCNVVDCHTMGEGGVFLLSGTNSNKGEVLRTLHLQNKQLHPLANFEGNKQIVRDSVFDAKSNVLITAGESGIVTLWNLQTAQQAATLESNSKKLKHKNHLKSKKNTPY